MLFSWQIQRWNIETIAYWWDLYPRLLSLQTNQHSVYSTFQVFLRNRFSKYTVRCLDIRNARVSLDAIKTIRFRLYN